MHLKPDARNILAGDVMEIQQELLLERRFFPIPPAVLLTIAKSGLIVKGTIITLEDYDDT